MPRSEAKKAADKRYLQKIQREGKHKDFVVHFNRDEYERIDAVIKASGMTKADFIRVGAELLDARMICVYPALFRKEEDGYTVEFPDLPGCLTCGDTLEEAFLMAGDALQCYLSSEEKSPAPSRLEEVAEENVVTLPVRPAFCGGEGAKRFLLENMKKTDR